MSLEYKVELSEIVRVNTPSADLRLNYVAFYDGKSETVTLYAGLQSAEDIVNSRRVHSELKVGSGSIYVGSDGLLVLDCNSLRDDVLPHRVANILAVIAQGRIKSLGVDVSGSRSVIDESRLNPFWNSPKFRGFLRSETVESLDSDAETSLVHYDPKMFDQKSLEKIGSTPQQFSKALALAGLPQDSAEDVLYLMAVRHDDAGLRPGDLVRLSDVGFKTVDDISNLLTVEEAMSVRSDAWDISAEAEILERARRTKFPGDVSTAEFVRTMQDARRYALHLLTSRFSGEVDLEGLSDDYLSDLDSKLKGSESLHEKIFGLVALADSCEVCSIETAIKLYNNSSLSRGDDDSDEDVEDVDSSDEDTADSLE